LRLPPLLRGISPGGAIPFFKERIEGAAIIAALNISKKKLTAQVSCVRIITKSFALKTRKEKFQEVT